MDKTFDMPNLLLQIKMKIRWIQLRLKGVQVLKDTAVFGAVDVVGNPKNILIGRKCCFNQGVHLNAGEKIVIGNNVTFSTYVQVHTGYYQMDHLPRKHIRKPITIEDNVWIAGGVVISAGVRIEKNCVIGANSVVTNDLEPDCFYAGAPAKKIRKIIYKKS